MLQRLVPLILLLLPVPAAAQSPELPLPPPDTLANACSAPEFRQFDFWIGRWSVAGPGREPQAVNEITRQAQGCLVQERYHNAAGYTGSSVNWFDPADRLWRQLWIDNAGLILRLEGGLEAPGRMVLTGPPRPTQAGPIRDRITWVAQADGTVHQIWDVSDDEGRTWTNSFTGIYRRLPTAGPPDPRR